MRTDVIYLDNGATTAVDPAVVSMMDGFHLYRFGNASSVHALGREAKDSLEDARRCIAKSINASPGEIYFTSGGTESNNLAIKGIAFANKGRGNHIITTAIEHSSVLNSCAWLETQGFTVTYLPVDEDGFITPEQLEEAITPKTILVSVLHGNNEIGTIQELQALGKVCTNHTVYFHTDACQSYTKTEIDVKSQNQDLVTLNAHKIHGPKGVGAIYIREKTRITPWQHGGGQEQNIRGGTEDIPGVVGFAEAAKIALDGRHITEMSMLRDRLIEGILQIPDSRLNGPKGTQRLCNNVNISFKGIDGDSLREYLDDEQIRTSNSSACSERTMEPSHVLTSIGVPKEYLNGSIRLTISRFTTNEEIDYVLNVLPKIIQKLRKR